MPGRRQFQVSKISSISSAAQPVPPSSSTGQGMGSLGRDGNTHGPCAPGARHCLWNQMRSPA